ncbi:MAG: putative cardiolipin synthase [Saprospiraceae bacterium]|jgi:putative cardiolipin synthase
MKYLLSFIFAVLTFTACKRSVPSPIPPSHDYCYLLAGTQQHDTFEPKSVDFLTRDGKTGIYVLEEGSNAITTRANLSLNALETMDIQYFIFSEDNIGTISCDYMLRAACRGVKVRVIVDDLLLDTDYNYILALDQHENVEIKIYNPNMNIGKNMVYTLFKATTDFRGINQRMHHKTYIVDGTVAITGGRNIADEYFDFDHEYNFRDRDVLLVGGQATEIQDAFDEYWNSDLSVSVSELIEYSSEDYDPFVVYKYIYDYSNDSLNYWPKIRNYIPYAVASVVSSEDFHWVDDLQFISDVPGKNDGSEGLGGGGNTTSALIDLVNSAKKEIYIQSPYLIVSSLGLNLFKNAVDRGVEVYILTNSLASTDNLEAYSGYQRNRQRLLNAGIHLYEYKPDAAIRKNLMTGDLQKKLDYIPVFGLHAKSMVVDDSISVIGTFNLDPRSANLNTECIIILSEPDINTKMKSIMKKELEPQNAWHVIHGSNPDAEVGQWKRFKAWTKGVVPVSVL